MTSLQVRTPDLSATKQKALKDAKRMQESVAEACTKAGRDPPPYQFLELIGKGSFGRVYKATSLTTKQLVAVKIIDIEESDSSNPKLKMADTYNDLLKEINALKMLSNSGAKNINHVIEAIPVEQSMWMVTEYCAGGSVSTLMAPTAPGGLREKWIIPILREVAEAMFWVHEQGIIHRDIKCANILVTEIGDVQLCDFGVAGVIETKTDKRTTMVGTPHWMAPELFDQSALYGTEVDIWAFGAMVYEIASGVPPNVTAGMDFARLGHQLKHSTPRLEGDQYSAGLKDLIAFCLRHDPGDRPAIRQIQQHHYLFNTSEAYPTSSLSHLVRGFKLWEAQGGDRRSLFNPGGAQGLADLALDPLPSDEWNFSTTASFDQEVFDRGEAEDVYDAYGSNVDFSRPQYEETKKPKSRRRPPPNMPSLQAPLQKLFDPNTMSNYEENSRAYYGRNFPPPLTSDLPLRDDSMPAADVRESLIDLDASLHGSDLSSFVDLNTIRAVENQSRSYTSNYTPGDASMDADFTDSLALNDPNRRTQDWKFPTMPAVTASTSDTFTFPPKEVTSTTSHPARPPLLHHPTEPIPSTDTFSDLSVPATFDNRASVGSLIDLDMSFADSPDMTDYTRPSTAHSDVPSISGSEISTANPFELEKHASLVASTPIMQREPSIYVSEDSEYASPAPIGLSINGLNPQPESTLSTDPIEATRAVGSRPYSLSEFADMDPEETPQAHVASVPFAFPITQAIPPPPSRPISQTNSPRTSISQSSSQQHARSAADNSGLPPLPDGPSAAVMMGRASPSEVRAELRRLAQTLGDHLNHASGFLNDLPVRRVSARYEPNGEAADVLA